MFNHFSFQFLFDRMHKTANSCIASKNTLHSNPIDGASM